MAGNGPPPHYFVDVGMEQSSWRHRPVMGRLRQDLVLPIDVEFLRRLRFVANPGTKSPVQKCEAPGGTS